jgi:hypothetical protein
MSLIVNTLANLITIDIAVYLTRKKKCCSPVFLHVHTIPMEKRNFIMFKKKKKKLLPCFFHSGSQWVVVDWPFGSPIWCHR